MKKITPFLRGGVYHLKRRVPRRYIAAAGTGWVQISLATDSLEIACRKAESVWAEHIEAWESLLNGDTKDAEARLAVARNIAARRGFRWLHVDDVSRLPLHEVINRLDQIKENPTRADLPMIEAMLGTPGPSKVKVSDALDEFYRIADDRLMGKNEDQLRRHKNPRKKATAAFIAAVGDKALTDITTADMFTLRAFFMPRVKTGEIKPASANKDFTYLMAMWKTVAQAKGFRMEVDTGGLAIKDVSGQDDFRPPFSDDWIRTKLLAPDALGGLNNDARLIVLGLVNTGARPSEIAGLMAEDIVLDGNVPHIIIRPNENRSIKNRQSRREVPILGVSLEAFRSAPRGFPRYAKNSATLSATVNKYFAAHNLLETPDHSLYSLRHAMEDRMLRAGIDERVRMDVLGHQIKRERYGEGGGLSFMQDQLLKVAI